MPPKTLLPPKKNPSRKAKKEATPQPQKSPAAPVTPKATAGKPKDANLEVTPSGENLPRDSIDDPMLDPERWAKSPSGEALCFLNKEYSFLNFQTPNPN